MRKLSIFLLVGIVALLAVPAEAQVPCGPTTVDLIAAQHYDMGEVNVSHDANYVTVEYVVTEPGYCLTETHLYVDPLRPEKSAPGQFGWGDDELGCMTGWSETISWANLGGAPAPLWVAAHAVVCGAGADYSEFELGLINEMTSTASGRVSASLVQNGPSYWQVTFNDGEELAGKIYAGWCVDTQRTIGGTHQMLLIPSFVDDGYGDVMLNPTAAAWVDRFDNLDLVNWIINQSFVGQPSTCDGNYTYGDVQKAIWQVIDNNPQSTSGLGPWQQCRADEILAAAWAYGEGFVPTCGQVVAVLMVDDSGGSHQTTIFQVTFFELGLPCVPTSICETAWGEGEQIRAKKNWAMTFLYGSCE